MTDETKSWHGGKPVGSQVATFGRTLSSEEKYKNTVIGHKTQVREMIPINSL